MEYTKIGFYGVKNGVGRGKYRNGEYLFPPKKGWWGFFKVVWGFLYAYTIGLHTLQFDDFVGLEYPLNWYQNPLWKSDSLVRRERKRGWWLCSHRDAPQWLMLIRCTESTCGESHTFCLKTNLSALSISVFHHFFLAKPVGRERIPRFIPVSAG